MSRALVLVVIVSLVALGLVLWASTYLWQGLGDSMSGHGWVAYVMGGVMTVGLSIGLFLLTFHSARHGYDDIERRDGLDD